MVGWTFKFRLVIWAPVWLISRPTDPLAVSVTLGYVSALWVFRLRQVECSRKRARERGESKEPLVVMVHIKTLLSGYKLNRISCLELSSLSSWESPT
jgi:hypothetical protein